MLHTSHKKDLQTIVLNTYRPTYQPTKPIHHTPHTLTLGKEGQRKWSQTENPGTGGFFLAKELQHSEDTKLHKKVATPPKNVTKNAAFRHVVTISSFYAVSLLQLGQQTDGHNTPTNTHTPTWYFIIGHQCVCEIQLSS